jgi:hypothetical protein
VTNTIARFRVEGAGSGWDLLRKRDQARRMLGAALVDRAPRLEVKVGDNPWRELGSRAEVMERFDGWQADGVFKVALRRGDERALLAAVHRENVRLLDGGGTNPGTDLNWSLMKHAFPWIDFGGGYVYKQTSPGVWSDHAHRDAVDGTTHQEPLNSRVTDWVARMARAGAMDFDYALGSRGGNVVIVYSDGDMAPSGASSSHKWHVHISTVDHDGRHP